MAPEGDNATGGDSSQSQNGGNNSDASSGANETQDDGDLDIDGMSFEDLDAALVASKDPKARPPKKEKAKDGGDDDDDDGDGAGNGDDSLDGGNGDDAGNGNGDDTLTAGDGLDGKPLAKNYRLATEDPQRQKLLTLMRRNPDADVLQLALRAGYTLPKAEAAAAAVQKEGEAGDDVEAEPAALKPYSEAVTTLEAEYAALVTAIEEAETKYNPTGKLSAQLASKAVELHAAKESLKQAKVDVAEHAQWQAGYNAELKIAKDQAFGQYPALAKKGTLAFILVRGELEAAEEADPKFCQDPKYPIKLIERLQAKYPQEFPKKGAKVEDKKQVVQQQPGKPARVLGETAAGNRGTDSQLGEKELLDQIENLSEADLEKLADRAGSKPHERKRR